MGRNTQHPKSAGGGKKHHLFASVAAAKHPLRTCQDLKTLQYLSLGYFNPHGLPYLIPSLHE